MIMAVSAIGGVSSTAYATPAGGTAPADGARRAGDPESKDSTIVISKITKTNPDGSTTTTIAYADGHTKVEITPPKQGVAETQGARIEEGGRVTAVDILA
jgi:hypothetical protein